MHEHGLTGEVVVTWPGYDVDGPTSGRLLRDAGLTIRLEPKTGARTSAEVIALLGDAVGVIASNDPFPADVFDACPNLKVIARTGVGVDCHRRPGGDQSRRAHRHGPGHERGDRRRPHAGADARPGAPARRARSIAARAPMGSRRQHHAGRPRRRHRRRDRVGHDRARRDPPRAGVRLASSGQRPGR